MIVDTLRWMLSDAKAKFGFKKKVVLLSDGSCAQNWSKEIFNEVPQIAVEYKGDQELQFFRAQKSVSGHSKG